MWDKIVKGTTLELLAFFEMVRLNIMLYNSLYSECAIAQKIIQVIRPQSACQ